MTQVEPNPYYERCDERYTPTISVVIPAHNEADNLREILPMMPTNAELILVTPFGEDDGSVKIAQALRPDIVCIHHHRKGKGNALQVGFDAAQGDIIVMFDADGSSDPTEIDWFVAALRAGADMAKGSRYVVGGSSHDLTWWRSLGNRVLTRLANKMFGTAYTDLCYGYMAFWRNALDDWAHLPEAYSERARWGDGFEIEAMLIAQFTAAGAPIVEVPSVERGRIYGHSNLHPIRDGLRILRTLVVEYLRKQS